MVIIQEVRFMVVAPIRVKAYKALVDEALSDTSLKLRQNKAAAILSEAQKHCTREEFKELQDYVSKNIDK